MVTQSTLGLIVIVELLKMLDYLGFITIYHHDWPLWLFTLLVLLVIYLDMAVETTLEVCHGG